MHRFEIWISPKVTGVGLRYLWGIYINIISFFSHNFHGRNFYPRRNFDRKPTIEGGKKGQKSIPEAKKSDFFAISKVIRTIWRETPELIYVHISSLIEYEYRPNRPIYQNSKIMIFWPFLAYFYTENQPKKFSKSNFWFFCILKVIFIGYDLLEYIKVMKNHF